MIYGLVSWLEENIDEMIENPPLLSTLYISMNDDINGDEDFDTKEEFIQNEDLETLNDENIQGVSSSSQKSDSKNQKSTKLKEHFELLKKDKNYQDMLSTRQRLPSFSFMDQILNVYFFLFLKF